MARTIERSVEINCPPDRVWGVLMDFPGHAEWNPFIQEISGNAQVGERLRVHIAPPGGRSMVFRPVVTAAKPNREFGWLGKLGVKGLIDGAHSFHIDELPDGRSRLTQSETFSGILVGLLGSGLDATAGGFDQMNQALQQRCESRPST